MLSSPMFSRRRTSFPKEKVKILLLEGVDRGAIGVFEEDGYKVEYHTSAMSENDLKGIIGDVHIIGIRSATQLSEEVLVHAKRLLCIGCFCIGKFRSNFIDKCCMYIYITPWYLKEQTKLIYQLRVIWGFRYLILHIVILAV